VEHCIVESDWTEHPDITKTPAGRLGSDAFIVPADCAVTAARNCAAAVVFFERYIVAAVSADVEPLYNTKSIAVPGYAGGPKPPPVSITDAPPVVGDGPFAMSSDGFKFAGSVGGRYETPLRFEGRPAVSAAAVPPTVSASERLAPMPAGVMHVTPVDGDATSCVHAPAGHVTAVALFTKASVIGTATPLTIGHPKFVPFRSSDWPPSVERPVSVVRPDVTTGEMRVTTGGAYDSTKPGMMVAIWPPIESVTARLEPNPGLAAHDTDVLVLFASTLHVNSTPVGPYVITVPCAMAVPGVPKPVPRNVTSVGILGFPEHAPPSAGSAPPFVMLVIFAGWKPAEGSGTTTGYT